MLVRINVSPEEGTNLDSRETNLEQVMNSALRKLQILERKEKEHIDPVSVRDLLPEDFDKVSVWSAEVFNQCKVLKEKLSELEENNKSLSVLNTDLLRRNHLLEKQLTNLWEKLLDNSLVKTNSELFKDLKQINQQEMIIPESGISQSSLLNYEKDVEPMLESNTGVCDHCLQITYPLHSYSNIHLENNQLKYQNIHLESQKLSLDFQNRILKQEVSKLKDSSRLGSQAYSQIDDDLSSLEKVVDLVDDNDENIGNCDTTEKSVIESENLEVFAEQYNNPSNNVGVEMIENTARNDDSKIEKLKKKISQLKCSKSVLKKRTRELLSEYRKKRETLYQRDEQVNSYKIALVKLKCLHLELEHSHTAILESIKAELEAVVEYVEKENVREFVQESSICTIPNEATKGNDEEDDSECLSVVTGCSEAKKYSKDSMTERNYSVMSIQTLIGLIKSLISQNVNRLKRQDIL